MDPKPGIDKNTIFAILICAGIWFAWQNYLEKKYPEAMHPQTVSEKDKTAPQEGSVSSENKESGSPKVAAVGVSTNQQKPALPKGQETTWNYEDENWKLTVSSFGGRISEVILKKYTDRESQPVALVRKDSPGYLTTSLEGPSQSLSTSAINYTVKPLAENKVELDGALGGVNVRKVLTVEKDKYIVNVDTEISGQLANIKRVDFQVSAPAPEPVEAQGIGSIFSQLFSGNKAPPHAVAKGPEFQEYYFSYGTKSDRLISTPEKRTDKNVEQAHFAALGSRYFTTMLFNRSDVLPTALAIPQGDVSLLRLSYKVLNENSPSPINANFSLYAGPKLLAQLQQVDETAGQVMDLGKFSWIAIPLLKLMKLLYELFRNWGAAIIGLTILVRLVTYPFTYMSYRSMRAMQKIQPEMNRVREKYKDNPTVMNQEVMRLWKENKVNPMGGCLPVFLQLPVFWALYTVLQNSIELYHAPFILWIQDLSLKDPYYVTPVLMGITMFIQQRMTPNTMDPAQAKMMMIMPVFFALLMMNLPSGLTLYIFVSTLFGIVQQYFTMRDRGTPSGGSPVTVVGSVVRGTSSK